MQHNIHDENEKILENLTLKLTNKYPHVIQMSDANRGSLNSMIDSIFCYYEKIISSMPGNVYWMDSNCKGVGCNSNVLEMFGFTSAEQFKGLSFEKMGSILNWTSETTEKFKQDTLQVFDTGEANLNLEEPPFQAANGEIMHFLTSRVPVHDTAGRVLAVIGISIDISSRKVMEQELLQAKNKAELANELKTKFIQNMQHDIRTPLTGIFRYMEMWAQEETDPEKKADAELMCASTGQLLNMCNELVDFERIDYLGDSLTLESVEVTHFLKQVINLNKITAHIKKLDIEFFIDPAVPEYLNLDRKKLYHVLINLIGNSLKFTEHGSVNLHVKLISINDDIATVAFEVHDTGVGIPSDKLNLIFDKFVRLSPSNQGKYKGTGLGLFYVKKFVEDMNGKVFVVSEENKGSIFSVTLPLSISRKNENNLSISHQNENILEEFLVKPFPEYIQQQNNSKLEYQHDVKIQKPGNGLNILLIEDDKIQQKIIIKTMKGLSIDITKTVASVSLSCKALKEEKYDLVISDLGILEGSGLDVINWAKNDKTHPNINTPFVALTANGDMSMRQQTLAAGFLNVFQKPLTEVKAQEIMNIFNSYIEEHKLSLNLPDTKKIIDVEASLNIMGGDEEIFNDVFSMLSISLLKDRENLQLFYQKNDIISTRNLLHRLDGTFGYCIVPQLKISSSMLHKAVKETDSLKNITSLYNQFYKEIDNFLIAYEKLIKERNKS